MNPFVNIKMRKVWAMVEWDLMPIDSELTPAGNEEMTAVTHQWLRMRHCISGGIVSNLSGGHVYKIRKEYANLYAAALSAVLDKKANYRSIKYDMPILDEIADEQRAKFWAKQ
jgi:hypothetical protein